MKPGEVKCPLRVINVLLIVVSVGKSQNSAKCGGTEVCVDGAKCFTTHCSCRSGYTQPHLVEPIQHVYCLKMCSENDECRDNSTCKDIGSTSYRCVCSPGYTRSGETGKCIDVDECSENVKVCNDSLQCENTVGSYSCVIPPTTYKTGMDKLTTENVTSVNLTQTSRGANNVSGSVAMLTRGEETNQLATKLIIGLAAGIGGAAILVFIIAVILIVWKRRHAKHRGSVEISTFREQGRGENTNTSPVHNYKA